jgi:putative nucleotidyltransferase with HDIG domain
MPRTAKFGSRERSAPGRVVQLLENLRSQVGWLDFLVGAAAAGAIAAVLVGFRYSSTPSYRPGEIAAQDVRAPGDIFYPDPVETEKRREAARAAVPVVYDLDTVKITAREKELNTVFEAGREMMLARHVGRPQEVTRQEEKEFIKAFGEQTNHQVPDEVAALLLRHRFSLGMEAQILRALDGVLRAGIIADRAQIRRDLKGGIVVRDAAASSEQRQGEGDAMRDVVAARDSLRQFALEFPELSATERRTLFTFLDAFLEPNLTANPTLTASRREAAANAVIPAEQLMKKGKTIVRSGDEVTPTAAAQIAALRKIQGPKSVLQQFLGFYLVAAILVYALWRYFVNYQSRHRKIRNHTLLILVIIVGVLAVTRLLTSLADILSERVSIGTFRDPTNLYYAVPFAFGAVLVTLLVDTNFGIFTSMALAVLVGLYYGDAALSAYVVLGSLAGVYSIRQYKDRAAILKAGLTIGLVNTLALVAFDALRQSPPEWSQLTIAVTSGILASAMASMLLPALESLFHITTDIRLLELSNLNAPILRRLSVEAPGTYHHSLMVGTLAEAAAEVIGANPLLVRVAAYYHDLGKMLKPEYFIENQLYGMNKHERLSPNMSCLIIASHVKDGLELAKEIGLAERIRDMIPQHHGTRIMTYFYQKAKDSLGPEEVVETDFRYPGPKPQSKEAAIMMMADSVEAASRTLTNPTPAQIQGMIDRLADAIVADNQFDECDITLREVRLVKESFFKILSGIYHRRIDYPGYDFKDIGAAPTGSEQDTSPKQAHVV